MDPRRILPVLAAVTAVLVIATLVTLGWRAWAPTSGADSRAGSASPAAGPPTARPGAAARPDSPAAVLTAWDARRARAWARGDTAALERLYVAGSRAGEADVRLLGRYARRGLRVTGLQTQVLDLDVVVERGRRLHLVVTDRVVGGKAVGAGGTTVLPRDRPSTRHVVLVRVDGRWLVDRVRDESVGRPQPRAAARTSRTSRSSKS